MAPLTVVSHPIIQGINSPPVAVYGNAWGPQERCEIPCAERLSEAGIRYDL